MKLYLVRRWGPNAAGQNITVDDPEQAQWLLNHNFAQRTADSTSVTDNAVAPGTHGPDPRAGGDGSRLRPTSMRSSDTRENRAVAVAGSPVQYNAGVAPTQVAGGGDEGSEEQASAPSSKVSGSGRRKSS